MPQAEEYTVGQYSEHWVVPEEPKGCRCGGDESTGHRRNCPMAPPWLQDGPYAACQPDRAS